MAHDHDTHSALDNDNIHPVSKKFLWLGDEKVRRGFIWLPFIGLAITVTAGFIYPFDPHHKAPWDFFASWAVIGFLAYCLVVLSAEPLFKWLSRPENYYGEDENHD